MKLMIHKQVLHTNDVQDCLINNKPIPMVVPFGARLLDAQFQQGLGFVFWYSFPMSSKMLRGNQVVYFIVAHTGVEFDDLSYSYVSTILHPNGLVFHVYSDMLQK